jgi:AraC-like DNA-binding protein
MYAKRYYDDSQFRLPEAKVQIVHQYQEDFIDHSHSFNEIVIVVNGHGVHYLDGNPTNLVRGDVFLIKENQHHNFQNTQDLEIINVLFESTYLRDYYDELRRMPSYQTLFHVEPFTAEAVQDSKYLNLDTSTLRDVVVITEQIQTELSQRREGYGLAIRVRLLELVLELCRQNPSNAENGYVHPYLQLGSALSFIAENYNQRIGLSDFEREMSASQRTINRVFKKLTGKTPIEYLIHYRVTKAEELLSETHNTVIFIAQNCGFNDSAHFCTTFKKVTGRTPREYRAAMLEGEIAEAKS